MDITWIIYALLTAFFWAFSNVIDKEVLVKHIKNPMIAVCINGIVGIIAASIVVLLLSVQIKAIFSIASFVAGMVVAGTYYFYYKTIKKESVAAFVTIESVIPVFVLILSLVFLKSIISSTQLAGLVLLIVVPLIISLKKDQITKKFFVSSIIVFALAASLCSATSQVLDKFSLMGINFLSAFVFVRCGTFLSDIPIIIKTRKDLARTMKKAKILSLMVFSELLTVTGSMFFLAAASLGNIALVSSLTNIQPLFIISLSIIFSNFTKSISMEIEKQNLIKILISLPFVIFGVYLISG
jgi:uncharacterized membrane protein